MTPIVPERDVRVLAAYLAPHLAGARVLYVGDLEDAGPLLDAGARLVHAYHFRKPASPLRGPVLMQAVAAGLDLPTGGFDLAIVDDLGKLPALGDFLTSLRGALGTRGIAALVAHTGAGALDYTELFDACSTRFEHVKMVGKLPFTGTLLCELGLDTEPEVSVDTELAELGAPTTLLALVSQRPFALDEYAIFAHPLTAPSSSLPAEPAERAEPADAAEMARLARHNQALEAQLLDAREARAQTITLQRELETAIAATSTARREALELRNTLEAALTQQADNMAGELETEKILSELAVQSERAEESEARALTSAAAVVSLQQRVDALEARAAKSLGDAERAQQRAAAAIERAEHAERDAAALAARPAADSDSDSDLENEVVALEASLRERGVVILELQAELDRRERMVTQLLLSERFSTSSAGTAFELESKLDELAKEVARRAGELEARGWRIQELESALAESRQTPDSLG